MLIGKVPEVFWQFWTHISAPTVKLLNYSRKLIRHSETVNNKFAWKVKKQKKQKNQTFLKYFF